jgi:hypothetical protein
MPRAAFAKFFPVKRERKFHYISHKNQISRYKISSLQLFIWYDASSAEAHKNLHTSQMKGIDGSRRETVEKIWKFSKDKSSGTLSITRWKEEIATTESLSKNHIKDNFIMGTIFIFMNSHKFVCIIHAVIFNSFTEESRKICELISRQSHKNLSEL